MKKILMLLIPLALACGGKSGPSPEPTPPPAEPTENPEPCKRIGVGADGVLYAGDCKADDGCKQNADGTFSAAGSNVCHTR